MGVAGPVSIQRADLFLLRRAARGAHCGGAGLDASRAVEPSRIVAAVFTVAPLLFGILTMNRGYIFNLGVAHDPAHYDTDLRLDRAGLRIHSDEAQVLPPGRGPGAASSARWPSGRRARRAGSVLPERAVQPDGVVVRLLLRGSASGIPDHWKDATVVVLNHRAAFSHSLAGEGLEQLRRSSRAAKPTGTWK